MMTSLRALLGRAAIFVVPASGSAAPAGAQFFPADEDLRLMLRYLVEDGEAPAIVFQNGREIVGERQP